MSDKDKEIDKLKRRIAGLEKTIQIMAGHSSRAEQDLRGLFEVASDTIPVPLVISSKSGEIIFANEKAQEIFGYSEENLRAINGAELYQNPDDRLTLVRNLADEAEVRGFAVNMKKADGSVFPASLFSRIITFEGRKCLLTVTYDLSDLRREEERRLALERQLRHTRKMEAVGNLAGGIAHDFNNLLQAISGYTQILLFDKTESSDGYRELKQIEKSAGRAARLIRQLLTFSRKAGTDRRPLDLNREVAQAGKILERTIPKMIAIHIKHASDLRKINADPDQIEQILLNSGSNAADAMPAGGHLSIETENIRFDERYCAEHPGVKLGEYVRLTITDTGHGMDEETVRQIFEPFFTTKEVGKGTGLGMASVYGIVKHHGGYISCESKPGQGTTFKIDFPAIPSAEKTRQVQKETEQTKGGSETILVVDDDESIRHLAKQILQSYGYQVITACSGEKAIAIYEKASQDIDLVILDIGMPGMGGHQCLSELLRIDRNVKVVIASGYAMDEEVKKSLEAGAAGFMGKPYELNKLLAKVREILDAGEI